MRCFHPHCPIENDFSSWEEVLGQPELQPCKGAEKIELLDYLNKFFDRAPSKPAQSTPLPKLNQKLLERLLYVCPCLYNQSGTNITPRGVIHLCELTLGEGITDQNVTEAFDIQHPRTAKTWKFPPAGKLSGSGGTVMELLCSEVLTNSGIPAMLPGTDGWPHWKMPGHILLNEKKMGDLKALGDILIPCAPTNLIISVKSEKARERLLYSANSIEGIGFGFFDEPQEFWTMRRMQLYKRMGFSAIYMPDETYDKIIRKLKAENRENFAVNINGTHLYRPITIFSSDMGRLVGKSAFDL
jgi:hypothetical protein